MAGEKRPSEIRLQDPLSAVTRGERRTLLGVSTVGILIAKTGLVPERISALGVEFERTDQGALLVLLALVIGYFLAAFLVYAASDLVAWRIEYRNSLIRARREQVLSERPVRTLTGTPLTPEEDTRVMAQLPGSWLVAASAPLSAVRALFEFALPVLVGAIAIYALLTAVPASRTPVSEPKIGAPKASRTGPTRPNDAVPSLTIKWSRADCLVHS